MAERALAGSVMTIRKGQTVLPTECEACGATMRNPTLGAGHVHRKGVGHFVRARKAQDEATNPTLPPENRGQNGPVPDHLVCLVTCLDRGAYWGSTPCLCPCHYQGLTARRMSKEAHND